MFKATVDEGYVSIEKADGSGIQLMAEACGMIKALSMCYEEKIGIPGAGKLFISGVADALINVDIKGKRRE